jgi:signal transduction histidine kinase
MSFAPPPVFRCATVNRAPMEENTAVLDNDRSYWRAGWILFFVSLFFIKLGVFYFLSNMLDETAHLWHLRSTANRSVLSLQRLQLIPHLTHHSLMTNEDRRLEYLNTQKDFIRYSTDFRKTLQRIKGSRIEESVSLILTGHGLDNALQVAESVSVGHFDESTFAKLEAGRKELLGILGIVDRNLESDGQTRVGRRMMSLEIVQLCFTVFIILFLIYPSILNEKKLSVNMARVQKKSASNSNRFRRMSAATLSILEDLEKSGDQLNAQIRKVDEKNHELFKANQELETYTYITSHDLRGPLRHIASYAELLYEKFPANPDAETNDLMNRIRKGVVRMKNLLDGLTEFQKISTATRFVEKVDINDAIQKFRDLFDEEIRATATEITCSELPLVGGSAVQIVQLLQNLLENAIKYRAQGVPPRIRIEHEVKGDRVHIAVCDNGRGVPQEAIPSLFAIFRRYDPGNLVEGLGVGLAICKKIVEIHGGKLTVESVFGTGCTFRFDLPLWVSNPVSTQQVQV